MRAGDFPGWSAPQPDPFDEQVQRLAREICWCAGDDPDAQVIPATLALPITSQGHKIVGDLQRYTVPGWAMYAQQARRLVEAGWRFVERKAEQEKSA